MGPDRLAELDRLAIAALSNGADVVIMDATLPPAEAAAGATLHYPTRSTPYQMRACSKSSRAVLRRRVVRRGTRRSSRRTRAHASSRGSPRLGDDDPSPCADVAPADRRAA